MFRRICFFFLILGMWGMLMEISAAEAKLYKIKTPPLKEKPALVIAAFGTSTKAQITFDFFDQELQKNFPDYEIFWAFTSDIIRAKMNRIYAQRNIQKRLLSLQEVLGLIYARGYRKAVVQPLQIFPGFEYKEVMEICKNFPGLRIVVGEPLLLRWENIHQVIKTLEREFLPPEEGINILAAHGTEISSDSANITYLGLSWFLEHHYPNVLLATVEGIPDAESVLKEAKKYPGQRVRFIPFMFVAGDHIMNDIMGQDPEEGSWRQEVEKAGKVVDCVTTQIEGKTFYKGLGLYPEVDQIFIQSIKRMLEILKRY